MQAWYTENRLAFADKGCIDLCGLLDSRFGIISCIPYLLHVSQKEYQYS